MKRLREGPEDGGTGDSLDRSSTHQQLQSWLQALDVEVEPDAFLGEVGEVDEDEVIPPVGGGGSGGGGGGGGGTKPSRARSNHLSTCHGALLLGGVDHLVETPGQRVCPACQALCKVSAGGHGQVFVDKARVRLLAKPIGTWSKARDFYTRWEALPGINAHARRFPLAGAQSGASLIVFKSAEQARACRMTSVWLPGTTGRA